MKKEYIRIIGMRGALYVLIPHEYAVKRKLEPNDYIIRIRKDDRIEYKLLEEDEKWEDQK